VKYFYEQYLDKSEKRAFPCLQRGSGRVKTAIRRNERRLWSQMDVEVEASVPSYAWCAEWRRLNRV
jgi:hypothetical protein